MSIGGSFMPLGDFLCPLGLKYAPPPPPGVRVPLRHEYPPASSCVPPPYVCTPWVLLSPLRLIYVHWRLVYAPWSSIMPLAALLCPLGLKHARPPLCVRIPPPEVCAPQAWHPPPPGIHALHPAVCASRPFLHTPHAVVHIPVFIRSHPPP
jgi:hypothetical protein